MHGDLNVFLPMFLIFGKRTWKKQRVSGLTTEDSGLELMACSVTGEGIRLDEH